MKIEEIIMALTCCAEGKSEWCEICPLKKYEGNCCAELAKNALGELKSLTNELQILTRKYGSLQHDFSDTCDELFKAEDEIVRLKKKSKISDTQNRSKVVYEMAARLKARRESRDGIYFNVVSFDTIDEIAIEMIGETK